jgi:hypothetical protein
MKKLSFIVLLFITILSNAQQKKDTTEADRKLLPYYIETCIDKMTDKSYAFGSKSLLCSDDGKKGIVVNFSWNYKGGGEPTYNGLYIKSAGIGNCVENSTLILLCEDDTKIKTSAWNKFNCEGTSYMDWGGKLFNEITSKKVVAIRFENGRTYDSYTYKLTPKEQTYFIEVGEAIANKRFVNGKCDD